jgi:subtilisin family serine protease
MHRGILARIARASGTVVAIALAASISLPSGPALAQSGGSKLSKHDRELIALARVNGESNVTLLIAAKSGAAGSLSSGVTALGGSIGFSETDIGYVRASVPLDKAEQVASLSSVQAIEVNEDIPLFDPSPDGSVPATPQTPPSASTPNNNPYMPIGDTGASQFVAANPTFDGRGTTIGIIDSGVTLDHPSLLTTSTGERKVVDWVTYTDPINDGDPTWVAMNTRVSGATFTVSSVTYTAPRNTSFRFGLFDERHPNLGGDVGNDVNRDGNPPGSNGIFPVLWHLDSETIWVDTNQNNSFADELGMQPYKKDFDVNQFGTDNPATAIRESMPFVVQTDRIGSGSTKQYLVNIGIVSSSHGSHVAGITAANSLFGGAMSGAAPGAKLVSVRVCFFSPSCSSYAMIEGMIYAAKYAKVDVINMSIGGLPSLNDGNNARAELYDRLIRVYKVQMFFSAGNSGPGTNTVGDPSVATTVMSVGSYITKATWQSNYGSDATLVDNLHYFSSRGPREDGGFKPNIVAPGSAISTTPLWLPGGPVAGTYALPPGYSMFNGTSMAAPQAAGAAALLISAAKQTGKQYEPLQLRQAINSSARLLDTTRFQVFEQGNGLFDVGAAWNLLATNIKNTEISSSVAVNTALSAFLKAPGFGVGIYDREGVTLGQSYTRQYTLVRTKGGSNLTNYTLTWEGNDGTFSAPATIKLPKGQPVAFDVTINPTTVGAHSAILNIDDPNTVGVDYQTMNVVVAPDTFSAGNNFAVTKTGSVGRNQVLRYFFRVPAGTPAFKVDFSGPSATPGTGQARFLRYHPYGVGIDDNASTSCYSPPRAAGCNTPNSRTVTNPFAGVWEVTVDAARTSDAADTPFTLTASILGATVSPNPDVIASATVGVPVARSYTLTNQFGAFTGRAVGTTLGSARIATPTIANLEQQVYEFTVTGGSSSVRATIGSPSDPAADLDLFLFFCPSPGNCLLAGQSADGDSEESVTFNGPPAGTWRVVIDGFAVPAGTTTYNYIDVFVNATFGSVAITDANAVRPSGAAWAVPGSVTANAAPATGRVLYGNVQVRTDANILVGQGDVIVQNVTPAP